MSRSFSRENPRQRPDAFPVDMDARSFDDPASNLLGEESVRKRLHSARYTFHKVVQSRYRFMVEHLHMTQEQGEMMYALAMQNYDDIQERAHLGGAYDANQASMDAGFNEE